MKTLIAAILVACMTGCAGSYYDRMKNGGGQQPLTAEQRDRLECENEGLKAGGAAGIHGTWNQVQVELNCLRMKGLR